MRITKIQSPDLEDVFQSGGILKGLTEDSSQSSLCVIHLQLELPHIFLKLLHRQIAQLTRQQKPQTAVQAKAEPERHIPSHISLTQRHPEGEHWLGLTSKINCLSFYYSKTSLLSKYEQHWAEKYFFGRKTICSKWPGLVVLSAWDKRSMNSEVGVKITLSMWPGFCVS